MNSTEKGNAGEKFVNDIAFNSFMKYWCYPSPKDELGDKKEICDLLILFKDCMIIISVKNYEFKDNYSRYFKNTINKAVKQIQGAERKLFSKSREIHIKHPDKKLEVFDKSKIKYIHRLIINLGEGVKFYPFNKATKDDEFITLFDKEAFETIANELDTIPDFIEYLSKREELFANKEVIIMPGDENDFSLETAKQFFEHSKSTIDPYKKKSVIISGTEHDLLAHYLKNKRTFPESLKINNFNLMVLQLDGYWKDFIGLNHVQEKKQADKNSYFIDELVKREVLSVPNEQSEEVAKAMLSFDRFHRRMIADNFLEFYESYKENVGYNFARRYGDIEGQGVVFAFYPPNMDQNTVNILLEITIESFCVYSKYKSSSIIVIATTKDFKQFKIGLMRDIKAYSKSKEKEIMGEAKKLGWFTQHKEIEIIDYEYPK